jgi:allantoate deiminase
VSEVLRRLDQLYAIGGGEGANRPGLSPEEDEAHRLVEGWMHTARLETARDRAGNLYGRRLGRRLGAPEVWCGSHLDTVPQGGRFDGALGVVAALAAAERIGRPLDCTLTVVAFRDEEGWRFGGGFFGSRAVTGRLSAGALDARDADDVSVRQALANRGGCLDGARGWLVPRPAAFVELHVEQGPVLADAGAALGVVGSFVGMLEAEVTVRGSAGHAGTTPMRARRDAGLAAAAFQVALADAAAAIPDAVATVGALALEPGASNVIPSSARVAVDARAPDDERLTRLERAIETAARRATAEHGCDVDVRVRSRTPPLIGDAAIRACLAAAAPGAPTIASGAGHDAQVLAAAGVPAGMLFVRSLAGGVSHSPLEQTAPADVEAAADALARALPCVCAAVDGLRRPRAGGLTSAPDRGTPPRRR